MNFLGEKSFTALQLSVIPDFVSNSLDFSFELSDYSHIEFDSPGIINIAGSIIGEKSPYIQAQVAINDFFIESAIQAGAFFLEEEKKSSVENLAQSFSSFMMTNDGLFGIMASKYLYIHDDKIGGNDVNNQSGTGTSGITYNNAGFVLRYVIGV